MLQQQFQQLASQITKRCADRLSFIVVPEHRVTAINDMGKELVALKLSYEQMSGETVTMPKFKEMMQLT